MCQNSKFEDYFNVRINTPPPHHLPTPLINIWIKYDKLLIFNIKELIITKTVGVCFKIIEYKWKLKVKNNSEIKKKYHSEI